MRHGKGLDVLINNAANMYRGAITELDESELSDIFNSNVVAAMMLSGLCVPHLEKKKGSILFVGSVHNRRAFPGASPYAATKAAVQSLTQVLAAELGAKKFGSIVLFQEQCSLKLISVPVCLMMQLRWHVCRGWLECMSWGELELRER